MVQVSSAEVDRIDSFVLIVTNSDGMIHFQRLLLITFDDSFARTVINREF